MQLRWSGGCLSNVVSTVLLLTFSVGFAATIQAEEVTLDCLIEPKMMIKLGSPVQGIIEEMPVSRGARIEPGQLLARLQSSLEETTLEMARTRHKYLESQYRRLTVVKKSSLASDDIVEQAKSEMESAALEIKRREILLEQRRIVSPIRGVIVERLLSPGEYVYEQTPLLHLAQTDELSVEVLVPTMLYGKIKPGLEVTVIPEKPLDQPYTATVEIVDGVLDAASSTFGVRLNLLNPELAIPAGLKCQAKFVISAE